MSQFPIPDYTEEELQALVGKSILVGVSYKTPKAGLNGEQFYGTISRIGFKEGIAVKLNSTNAERIIPLDFSDFELARPGKYTLTNTGEVIEDPYYTITVNM